MDKHLFLIGFMGAGKTTVGKLIAKVLEIQYFDVDSIVESRSGMTIEEIFSLYGETHFRSLESEILFELTKKNASVISTGGGVVGQSRNWACMRDRGLIVYLRADWSTLKSRLGNGEGRPLANQSGDWTRTLDLLNSRIPLYERADLIVDTDDLTADEVVSKILAKVKDAL